VLRSCSQCAARPPRENGSVLFRAPRRVALLLSTTLLLLPLFTGCAFIEQLFGGAIPGGGAGNAPQAVMTAEIDDDLVNSGLNPELRPPLWYQFSGADSLNEDGVSILDPTAGFHELAWDFGDGTVLGFTPSKSVKHAYREQGTYTASLTLRSASGATDTVQQTITIAAPWLEIVNLTSVSRPDGQVDITVLVRNQSQQPLRVFSVELLVDGQIWPSNLGVAFSAAATPDRLSPNATYTLTSTVGAWTGVLSARSSWCTPWPPGQ